MAEAVGVVDIFVPGKPTEHRLPELGDQGVAVVLAGPAVGQHLPGHLGQTEGIIEFPEGEQSGIGGDPGAVEFQLEAAVKSDPQIGRSRFTRRHLHIQPVESSVMH
ncbi:hypothetical protein BAL199_30537 [alpha proteobacterium BAL199]|nr:hypothetical protein BAL199_30537 [alpha proteobacterium BAL199]